MLLEFIVVMLLLLIMSYKRKYEYINIQIVSELCITRGSQSPWRQVALAYESFQYIFLKICELQILASIAVMDS
jgi:hypothetical protein